jgi:hypothetical protein
MISVKVLYAEGEEEQAKEILKALENVHHKRFFFSWVAYKETKGILIQNEEKQK